MTINTNLLIAVEVSAHMEVALTAMCKPLLDFVEFLKKSHPIVRPSWSAITRHATEDVQILGEPRHWEDFDQVVRSQTWTSANPVTYETIQMAIKKLIELSLETHETRHLVVLAASSSPPKVGDKTLLNDIVQDLKKNNILLHLLYPSCRSHDMLPITDHFHNCVMDIEEDCGYGGVRKLVLGGRDEVAVLASKSKIDISRQDPKQSLQLQRPSSPDDHRPVPDSEATLVAQPQDDFDPLYQPEILNLFEATSILLALQDQSFLTVPATNKERKGCEGSNLCLTPPVDGQSTREPPNHDLSFGGQTAGPDAPRPSLSRPHSQSGSPNGFSLSTKSQAGSPPPSLSCRKRKRRLSASDTSPRAGKLNHQLVDPQEQFFDLARAELQAEHLATRLSRLSNINQSSSPAPPPHSSSGMAVGDSPSTTAGSRFSPYAHTATSPPVFPPASTSYIPASRSPYYSPPMFHGSHNSMATSSQFSHSSPPDTTTPPSSTTPMTPRCSSTQAASSPPYSSHTSSPGSSSFPSYRGLSESDLSATPLTAIGRRKPQASTHGSGSPGHYPVSSGINPPSAHAHTPRRSMYTSETVPMVHAAPQGWQGYPYGGYGQLPTHPYRGPKLTPTYSSVYEEKSPSTTTSSAHAQTSTAEYPYVSEGSDPGTDYLQEGSSTSSTTSPPSSTSTTAGLTGWEMLKIAESDLELDGY